MNTVSKSCNITGFISAGALAAISLGRQIVRTAATCKQSAAIFYGFCGGRSFFGTGAALRRYIKSKAGRRDCRRAVLYAVRFRIGVRTATAFGGHRTCNRAGIHGAALIPDRRRRGISCT